MSQEPIEVEAKTVKEAIEKALEILHVSKDEIDVKILSEPKMGLFGMAGGKHAKVRVTLKKKEA
jgi:spoIIIJ-associated protein